MVMPDTPSPRPETEMTVGFTAETGTQRAGSEDPARGPALGAAPTGRIAQF